MSIGSDRLAVGAHTVDLRARTVVHDGVDVRLSWRHFEALALLIENHSAVVSKEQFLARLWPDQAIVDESNLTQCISQLRRALNNGDGADGIRYIETVPRMGYRLTAPVRTIDSPPGDPLPTAVTAGEPGVAPRAANVEAAKSRALIAASLVLVGVAAGATLTWPFRSSGVVPVPNIASLSARDRGEDLLRRGDAAGAVREFQDAVRQNPSDARAYSAMAHALQRQSDGDAVARPAGESPSVEAARRAVALDPRCGECQGTLGFFLFYHDWQWVQGETHLREAIRLAPSKESIRPALALLLTATGRLDEALEQIDFALERRPYEIGWLAIRASILYSARRYDEAVATADRLLALNDSMRGGWEWKSKSLFQLGRGSEAVKALAQEAFRQHSATLDAAVRESGSEGGLRALLSVTDIGPVRAEQSWRRIAWRAILGDESGALDELEQAYALRNVNLMYAAVDPVYERIRNHARFERVLDGMGLKPQRMDVLPNTDR